jgi:hypothetical protein
VRCARLRPRSIAHRLAFAFAFALWTAPARAADPIQLDVTETSVVAQHFQARTPSGLQVPPRATFEDSGWFGWVNRLNAALHYGHFTVGLRLDSAVYALRPVDQGLGAYSANPSDPNSQATVRPQVVLDNESRFRNSLYPAKLWATYAASGLEVTAGDAYVQFGRGLTLSMRKVDELGIDTTVRGAKVQITRDPFALTAVAGFANPSRVDEATGRALWVTDNLAPGDVAQPTFGSDRVLGLDVQAGRGLPVTLSTHAVRFTRCAPYHYDASGNVQTSFAADPATVTFGTCDPNDTDTWLNSLNPVPRGLQAKNITMAGESLESPRLWGQASLYIEAAVQHREDATEGPNTNGNALYAALSFDVGKTSTTLEIKSNRNFYTVAASVGQRASEFAIVGYSFLPPAESFNMLDAEGTGDFNACVQGGRLREDVNVSHDLLLYAQGVYAYSQTEQPNGRCDQLGRTLPPQNTPAASIEDVVWDGVAGFEYTFDGRLSHAFASAGVRDDTRGGGVFQYREQHLEYSIAKYLGGPWSVEIQGRGRHRDEQSFNLDANANAQYWFEGENYVAVRMAPQWVFSQGFEYTTLSGQPRTYVNGSVIYKFTSGSNVRAFVGEQRGAFRCASGICRFFPAFEGARLELTLRF